MAGAATLASKLGLEAMAALTTWANDPAPMTPNRGRAEIRLVKYSAGMPCALAFCTTGVVPMARSGLNSCIAARSCSSEARYVTGTPRAASHSRSLSEYGVRGQAVPT